MLDHLQSRRSGQVLGAYRLIGDQHKIAPRKRLGMIRSFGPQETPAARKFLTDN
jgi:hypothetical protein